MRKLPSRQRLRKHLFRETLTELRPDLFRIPRARDAETADYRPHLVDLEQADRGVTRFVFEGNPILEEWLDVGAVHTLIKTVCSSVQPAGTQRRPSILTRLPIGVRERLSALRGYWLEPAHSVSNVTLLLRVMTMAEALRQLHGRFNDKQPANPHHRVARTPVDSAG